MHILKFQSSLKTYTFPWLHFVRQPIVKCLAGLCDLVNPQKTNQQLCCVGRWLWIIYKPRTLTHNIKCQTIYIYSLRGLTWCLTEADITHTTNTKRRQDYLCCRFLHGKYMSYAVYILILRQPNRYLHSRCLFLSVCMCRPKNWVVTTTFNLIYK